MSPRRINLLPPEFVERRRARQRLTQIVAAALAVVLLLVAVFVFESTRLSSVKGQLADEQQTINGLKAKVQQLTDFAQLQGELQRKTALLTSLTTGEVRWSVLLADISLVIPDQAWLTTFTGSVSATTPTTKPKPGQSQVLGQIEMDGTTFTHLDVAKWLIRLGQVDAFVFPYLSLSSKAIIGTTDVVNFSSSVQLSQQAFRRNQPGAQRHV